MPKILFITCAILYVNLGLSLNPTEIENNMIIQTGARIVFDNSMQYSFSDTEEDGVIILKDIHDVVIDANQVELKGEAYAGYAVKIENCHNITIRNFKSIQGFAYGIYVEGSQQIYIEDSNISFNKKDDEGWIEIFEGPEGAHGGGVFMNDCRLSSIRYNTMTNQNDGVALYNCDSIQVDSNDLSWNTSFGIRMFHSHYCKILDNNASHINRPLTYTSDCAAILLLDAFKNVVTGNNFTYSGDGIFVNNYHTMEQGDNYFAYNDCSYSPHNAIESVFSSGNIFTHNKCNYSNYGLWLGYSFNTLVENNEIKCNSGMDADGGAGIAIDRGYNNVIQHNSFVQNSHGVKIWEGNPISPYEGNQSEDYTISGNVFYGNRIGIYADATDRLQIDSNSFDKNFNDIKILGNGSLTKILHSQFSNTISTIIENQSAQDILAEGNAFPDFSILNNLSLDCKITDQLDQANLGLVELINSSLLPFELIRVQESDLAEPPAVWDAYVFVEDAQETKVLWDYNDKVEGEASLYVNTRSGFDVHLHYFPEDDKLTSWEIDPEGSIDFSLKLKLNESNQNIGVQESFVRIGDACGNYIQLQNFLTASLMDFNQAIDQWVEFSIPLEGNDRWELLTHGNLDFTNISFLEFNIDVWEYGYEAWIDDIQLPVLNTSMYSDSIQAIQVYPNPAGDFLIIESPEDLHSDEWSIFDENGRIILQGIFGINNEIDLSRMNNGIYFISLAGNSRVRPKKFVVSK